MPRLVLTDWSPGARAFDAIIRLRDAGAGLRDAHAAVGTLLEGIPAFVDVERPDGVVADLAEMGIEAEIMADDEAIPAA